MARAKRLALAGELHHVLQRGHNRQKVFVDDTDRASYLALLRNAAIEYGVAIHAYVLLDTDVHLLATPREALAVSRLMQSMGRRYVAMFNRRHARSGTLWAGRFRTSVMEGAVMGADAVAYVETLPVQMGQAGAAADWVWSSARHHLGLHRDPLVTELPAYWAMGNTPFERELAHAHKLREGVDPMQSERIQRAVLQGRPVGSAAFAASVAERTGIPIQARLRGRPKLTGGQSVK
jgi:putative transposase